MDTISKEVRSRNMAAIKGKDTKPEIAVRKKLYKLGYRYRLHRKDLPGKPDMVLPKHKTVIFVHGCFWHQHKRCSRAVLPKSNIGYWIPKLERNNQRFEKDKKALEDMGWIVCIVWECEIKVLDVLSLKIGKSLRKGEKIDL